MWWWFSGGYSCTTRFDCTTLSLLGSNYTTVYTRTLNSPAVCTFSTFLLQHCFTAYFSVLYSFHIFVHSWAFIIAALVPFPWGSTEGFIFWAAVYNFVTTVCAIMHGMPVRLPACIFWHVYNSLTPAFWLSRQGVSLNKVAVKHGHNNAVAMICYFCLYYSGPWRRDEGSRNA